MNTRNSSLEHWQHVPDAYRESSRWKQDNIAAYLKQEETFKEVVTITSGERE